MNDSVATPLGSSKAPDRDAKRRRRRADKPPPQGLDESAAAVSLWPYAPARDVAGSRHRRWAIAGLLLFCLIYGAAFGLFAPNLLLVFMVPIVVLALMAIWALPDLARPPTGPLMWLFYAFTVALVVWPNYLAITLPSMPWITVTRLVGFPLVFLLLVCVSTSSTFRAQINDVLRVLSPGTQIFLMFLVIQALSVFFSRDFGGSLQILINDEMTQTAMFFVACYVFLKPGRAELWAAILWAMALVLAVMGTIELREGHVPWLGHLPSFIKLDENYMRMLAGARREGVGEHRVQGPYTTSLALSEYMAFTMPFLLHFAAQKYKLIVRVSAVISMPILLFTAIITQSRLGVIGVGLSFMTYLLLWALLRRSRKKQDLISPAIVFAYPAILTVVIAASFFIRRIHNVVWGGGLTASSTEGRFVQYSMGIPKILSHPWGYGIGQAGSILGYVEENGTPTIDTFYLATALDYGFIGFILYFALFFVAIYKGVKEFLRAASGDRELLMIMPLTVTLINFVVVKSVFNQQDNHPLIFMMLGMLGALIYRSGSPAIAQQTAKSEVAG
jgi:hypothetical protein